MDNVAGIGDGVDFHGDEFGVGGFSALEGLCGCA